MKKIFTTIIIVFGVYTASLAQQKKGDVELGIHIGYSFSDISNSDFFNSSFKSAFNAGIATDFYFSNRWSLKTKLIFDQKGWGPGFFANVSDEKFATDFSLNYITLPIMANWHFGKKRNWYLNFGPYAGYLAGAEATNGDIDVKDSFHSTDFGLALGIGTKIKLSNKVKLLLEYDEQAGITNIFKENTGSAVRNGRGSFNIGLNFIIK
ncbi:porin family protein [Mucilaginibacter pocheonensis]|uniref:Opacity protein-like surface antigen n=1 Tax=Mucilaginibacter pocheonensis TaxID=398050 RepID=A0ABU1T725_9SPHI|nr:porin family protein [Mucilaginibacter pocheonensis]MDR6941089.1 opacity protein-like surface antigen [Mucilaginibacter pocheonensis]